VLKYGNTEANWLGCPITDSDVAELLRDRRLIEVGGGQSRLQNSQHRLPSGIKYLRYKAPT
jgi:hypothetical protein